MISENSIITLEEAVKHINCGESLKNVLVQFIADSFLNKLLINNGMVFFNNIKDLNEKADGTYITKDEIKILIGQIHRLMGTSNNRELSIIEMKDTKIISVIHYLKPSYTLIMKKKRQRTWPGRF